MSLDYDEYLSQHRMNVFRAYEWIKTYIPEVIPEDSNLEWMTGYAHDISKNSDDEYDAYDAYFYGERTPEVIENFNYAWLHHIHNNPHHWQYWVLINDDQTLGQKPLEIPIDYALEMICDWWSFSFSKGNLSEIFDWYEKRKSYIVLHPNTKNVVEDVLDKIREKLSVKEE